VALGVAVSLVVAVLLWPRGARGQLRSELAALYRADAAFLDAAFGFLLGARSEHEVDARRRAARIEVDRAGEAFEVFLTERGSRTLPTETWGRVAAAGNDVLLAADAMEAVGLLGYRVEGCEPCARRLRRAVARIVGVFAGFARELEEGRVPPPTSVELPPGTRRAVAACLRAWGGDVESSLGRTAVGMAIAWFWSVEIARLAAELAEPLAAVARAARAPWWR
jgi:hypothetical protein